MKTKTQLSDFNFQFSGYGHYRVSYTSPATGKQWSTVISDMTLIDAPRMRTSRNGKIWKR